METSEFRLRCLSGVFRVWISIWTQSCFVRSESVFEGFNVPPQLLLLAVQQSSSPTVQYVAARASSHRCQECQAPFPHASIRVLTQIINISISISVSISISISTTTTTSININI